jgi:hypothetical protein
MMMAGTNLHMTFRSDRARSRGLRAFGACLALGALVSVAAAQQPGAPPPVIYAPPEQAAPAAAPPRVLPTPQEVFSGIGRLIDQSIANVNAGVKGASDTLGGVPNAAGDLAKGVLLPAEVWCHRRNENCEGRLS